VPIDKRGDVHISSRQKLNLPEKAAKIIRYRAEKKRFFFHLWTIPELQEKVHMSMTCAH